MSNRRINRKGQNGEAKPKQKNSDNTCMGMKSGSSEGLVPPATLISLIVHSKNDIKDRFCIENN
jgi:hypothetical protein